MARRRKNNGLKFKKGNRAYSFSYALSAMRSNPFRSLSLALTLSLGVALIASVMIWSDTGIQVSVDTYFENNPYQLVLENVAGSNQEIDMAEQYALNSEYVESTQHVDSVVGLLWGTELPDTVQYGLNEPIYTDGLKDCEVLLVDADFLSNASSGFETEGKFSLNQGEVLVSKGFLAYTYNVLGITLTINSTIDFELLTRRSSSIVSPIGDLGRVSTPSLKIVGIYEIEGYSSVIETAFPSRLRSNYDYVVYDTPVLGIRDSVMMLKDEVAIPDVSSVGFFGPNVFIRASSDALISSGPENIADNLLILKARINEQYDVKVEGATEVRNLQNVVNTYLDTLPLALLNLPIFILALFLSIYAADTFMSARTTEVGALRSKGASSSQIYGIFLAEAILMAILSIGLGLTISIVSAALIPSSLAFMVFDMELYMFYLDATVLGLETVIYTIIICIVPPMLFILQSARKAARTEIGSTLTEISESVSEDQEAHSFTLGASAVLLGMVLFSVLLLPANPILILLELGLGTAAWFFLAYNGSRISRVSFSKFSARLTFMLGEKNLISAGNLRMRKGRIVPLMVVLALTMSSTIAFTIQAHSFQADLEKEIAYAIGSDLRVMCTPQPFSFNDTIESYPGVNKATPILTTTARTGTERLYIKAIDALEYSDIGKFDDTSFFGEDSNHILSRLAAISNGIIMSEYHANRLNKTIGDSITLDVGGRLASIRVTFTLVALIHSAPGFGYAAEQDIPSSSLGAGFGFQAGLTGFALANLDFISEQTDITTVRSFMADLVCITDQEFLLRALKDLPGVSATTPELFDLKGRSFGTALFLSTVEGLFSIGFAMSLVLGMFAMTLFLGSVVRERKRDYAILRAVGGSRRMVVNIVFSEFTGIVLASLAFSLLLGTLFGFIMSSVVFSMSPFARILTPAITFPTGFLTAVLLLELIMMIAGAYFPAREAAKTDPAIVLRNL